MSQSVVTFDNLQFRWPRSSRPVLDIAHLDIKAGEHLFIQGPSGSGKTTLLNLLTGINQPDQGNLNILGQDLCTMTSIQRDRFRADHLGVIFQQFNLLPFLGIMDNVILPCRFSRHRLSKAGDLETTARQLLDELQIPGELISRDVMDLSVGQQQRVAAARALIGNPEIVIADEPTSALDTANRDSFINLLFTRATEHGSTLIFVSHDEHLSTHFSHCINLTDINSILMESSL